MRKYFSGNFGKLFHDVMYYDVYHGPWINIRVFLLPKVILIAERVIELLVDLIFALGCILYVRKSFDYKNKNTTIGCGYFFKYRNIDPYRYEITQSFATWLCKVFEEVNTFPLWNPYIILNLMLMQNLNLS